MEENTQQAGLVVRDGFQGQESMQLAELASRATAEQARAMVESRFVMALKRPRNEDKFRLSILKECKRPEFAEAALWEKPVGAEKISGFSIRFVEAALRHWGNVYVSTETIYDDSTKRIVRVTVTDLEANLTYPKDIPISKQVERRRVRQGQNVLHKRQNSQGETVYVVEASEDELLMKEAALASKAIRTSGLRVLPPDVQAEARQLVERTLTDQNAKDPDAGRKKVADAFAYYNILPDQLADWLGRPFAQATPDELRQLTTVYNALKENEATWPELLEQRKGERAPAKEAAKEAAPASSAAGATATERLAAKVAAKQAAPAAASGPVVETTATVVATNTAPAAAPAAKEPEPEAAVPKASEEPEAADPASPALTADGMLKLREHLTAKQAELVQLIGKAKAEAVWTGRDGVKTLRGCRLQAHAQERLDAADRVVELAKLDFELVAAVRELASKAGAQAATAITDGLAVLKQTPFSRDVRAAHEALDTLLGHLQAHGKQDEEEVEDLPWGDAAKAPAAREPGEEG